MVLFLCHVQLLGFSTVFPTLIKSTAGFGPIEHWLLRNPDTFFDLYPWQLPSLLRLPFKVELISFRLDLEFIFTFSAVTCPNVAIGRTRITPKFNFSEKEKSEKFGRPITHKELKSFSFYLPTWRLQIIDLYVELDWNNI